MTRLESEVVGTLAQVGVVLAFALMVYLLAGKSRGRFAKFVGLVPTSATASVLALALAAAAIWVSTQMPGFLQAARSPNSVVGKITAGGVTSEVIAALVLMAVVKTAFTEELFFRGIIGKRLMAWLGFHAGNFIQAALFGAIHLLIFLSPEVQASNLKPEYVVAFTGLSGWLSGWLNESIGRGSILPGWIAHATTNLITYLGLAYGYL